MDSFIQRIYTKRQTAAADSLVSDVNAGALKTVKSGEMLVLMPPSGTGRPQNRKRGPICRDLRRHAPHLVPFPVDTLAELGPVSLDKDLLQTCTLSNVSFFTCLLKQSPYGRSTGIFMLHACSFIGSYVIYWLLIQICCLYEPLPGFPTSP